MVSDDVKRALIARDAWRCWNCSSWDGYRHRCYDARSGRTGWGQAGALGWCEELQPAWVPSDKREEAQP